MESQERVAIGEEMPEGGGGGGGLSSCDGHFPPVWRLQRLIHYAVYTLCMDINVRVFLVKSLVKEDLGMDGL